MRTTAGFRRKAGHRHARNSFETGFTLIELLVVFSILALLLTLATPRYFNALDGGKEKVQAQNLATLRDAIDKFRADQGKYPAQLQEVVDKRYLREIPLDPVSGSRVWETLPVPNSSEPGIYDVRAPNAASPSQSPENAPPSPTGDTP
ncbi:prepilin-type N-terminal cleavage/methylation domain-containing protein [Polaromonas sp. SP1]|nr:prepilin-type N-terminal cleavage/methylation domain-containing protein [Polaromonas sp. SP1]AYQ30584.1 prepilin-type N-terminal cleavage/methylation domain-containing protein [Polaromonas sp. SP1]QGJ20849.1 prepilin-type N-terminal cleavage/methylation domain-containing protein [Polaromonas sp. Pch-P]